MATSPRLARPAAPAKTAAILWVGLGLALFAGGGRRALAQDAVAPASAYKDMSLEQLMNIDVTSVSKEPEPFSEAPAAIAVVTGDEIEDSGATSIPEALRLAGNLDVAEKNPHDWAISARGFNTELSNKLLVLMDGRSVYTPLFSGVFWDEQDYLLEDIDRIEVIAGPGGTLWGANAVNGVINITSKSARDTQGGYLEAGVGSELEEFLGVREGVIVAPSVFLRVYAKYDDRDSTETMNGANANDGWHSSQGGFRMDDLATPDTTLTLQGDAYSNNEGLLAGGRAKANGENVIGRWTRDPAPDSEMSLQVYYDRNYLSDPIPASAFAPAGILTDDLGTYDAEFQDRFHLGAVNGIVWGLEYRYTHDMVINAPGLAFYPTTLNQNLFSMFIQDEIRLANPLTLTVGSKLERNDYTGWAPEPSVRLKWDAAQHQMLWGAVSRAVRTPSRVDRDEDEPNPPPTVLKGEPLFQDETLVAYEIGYRAELSSHLSTSISTYYNAYDDIRSLSYTPKTIVPLYFANNLEGETDGSEINATWQAFSWWRLTGAYDLLHENIHVKFGESDINNALNETSDPTHQSSLRSEMDLPGRLKLGADLRWVGSRIDNNNGVAARTPAYSELGLRLAWAATDRLELSIVGQNLLHRYHIEYGIPGPGLEEIERNIYAKAAWHF